MDLARSLRRSQEVLTLASIKLHLFILVHQLRQFGILQCEGKEAQFDKEIKDYIHELLNEKSDQKDMNIQRGKKLHQDPGPIGPTTRRRVQSVQLQWSSAQKGRTTRTVMASHTSNPSMKKEREY